MTGYAKKNKMPESTLRGILKKKGLLLAEAEKGGRMKSKKNIREGQHAELELALRMWVVEKNSQGALPSNALLAAKALTLPATPNKPKLINFLIIHSHTCKYSKMQNLVGFQYL